jgi:hypothetical protein
VSWSVSAIGKAPAVKTAVAEQFAGQKCDEPEETLKQSAAALIAAALDAQDPTIAVKVSALGSQSRKYTTKAVTYLNIAIEPQFGVV